MKKAIFTLAFCLSSVVFASSNEKIDFQSQINQESKLQNETHQVLKENIKADSLSSINDSLKADSNKIILTTDGPQILDQNKKSQAQLNNKKSKKNKALAKNTKQEDEDFKRLEQELDSLSK